MHWANIIPYYLGNSLGMSPFYRKLEEKKTRLFKNESKSKKIKMFIKDGQNMLFKRCRWFWKP